MVLTNHHKLSIYLIFLYFLSICASCNPHISRQGYEIPAVSQRDNCNILIIKEYTVADSLFEIVGEIKIDNPVYSKRCGEEDVIKILTIDACAIKADLINIKEIIGPDIHSPCYRVKADFFRLRNRNDVIPEYIYNYKYKVGESKKYFNGVPLDSLSVPILSFKLGMGFEVIRPSPAIDIYIYIYRFGLSYAYGFSSTTRDKNKLIEDVKDAHHFRLCFPFGSLENVISFNPIYLGIGKSIINEKKDVQGFTGEGTIKGTHYFIGLRFLSNRIAFFNLVGTYFELGKSQWDYSDSILMKNGSTLKYHYPNFYFSLGVCYYLK